MIELQKNKHTVEIRDTIAAIIVHYFVDNFDSGGII